MPHPYDPQIERTMRFSNIYFQNCISEWNRLDVSERSCTTISEFNPIRPGGGGGLRGPDGQTHSCQSETSYPMMPKLGDF